MTSNASAGFMHQYTSNVTVYRANIEGHRYFLLVKLLKYSALDVHHSYQLTKEKYLFLNLSILEIRS